MKREGGEVEAAEDAGFVVKDIFEFNRIGTPAWFLNGKILRRHTFGLFQIWMLACPRRCSAGSIGCCHSLASA